MESGARGMKISGRMALVMAVLVGLIEVGIGIAQPTVAGAAVNCSNVAPNADLTGCDLSGANLSGADLSGANLSGADLSGANLGTDLNGNGINLSDANLTGANLTGANLFAAYLSGTDLTNANLTNANMNGAYLSGATLSGATLTNVSAYQANLIDANLSGVDLSGVFLSGANLSGVDLSGLNLSGANLFFAHLTGANLTGANLTGADLTQAGLSGANLTGADLTNAFLYDQGYTGADMTNTNLSGANLTGANLIAADLTGVTSGGITGTPATLPTGWQLAKGYLIGQGANLTGANLSGVDLSGVDLTNANLTGAILTSTATIVSGLQGGFGLAVDASGNRYVTETNTNTVSKISLDGTKTTIGSGWNWPVGVAVNSAGDVFVAGGNDRVVKVSADGTMTTIGVFNGPGALTLDADGNLFVANLTDVVEFPAVPDSGISADGNTGWKLVESGDIYGADGVAVAPDGTVYVSNYYYQRIDVLTPDGSGGYTRSEEGTSLGSWYPTGMSTDAAGNLYVTSPAKNAVYRFAPDGTYASIASGFQPYGVVVNAAGSSMYVTDGGLDGADYNSDRILYIPGLLTPTTPTITNPPDSGTLGGSFTPTVSTTSDGTTSVTSSTTSACTVDGSTGLVSYVGAGTCTLVAHVQASINYSSADGSAQSFTIAKATPRTPTITNRPAFGPFGGFLIPTVSTTGDGPTSVTSSTTSVCTVDGLTGLVSYVGIGNCTLVAHVQAGTNYSSADGSAQSFTIGGTTPKPPTNVIASSFANASSVVSWTAPANNGGSPITGYTATSNPGNKICTTVGGLTCTIPGLTNGTAYTFTVTATNVSGNSAASAASNSATPATLANAPTAVKATSNANASSSVSWKAPLNTGGAGITGYVVTPYVGSTAQTSQTFTSPALSETVTGLTNGTAYTFAVAAITGAGTGSLSLRSAKATPATAPDAPTNVTCFPCSASLSPAVAFVTPASNGGAPITGYTVTMIDNTDSTRGGQTFSGSASPISVSGFTNGDRYTFTVTATNAAGTGAAGTSGNILPIYPPAAPANVTASSFANASSVVSWTSVTSQVGVVSTPGGKQCTALYPLKSCTVTGLTNGTQYTFSASDATPAQGRSASATSNVAIPATLSNAPTGIKATSNANISSVVSWIAPQNTGGAGITGYVVTPYVGSVALGAQAFTSTATSETVTGLTNGTAYTFTVAAITGAGVGVASAPSAVATPYATPGGPINAGPPTNVTATSFLNASSAVSWTAPLNTGSDPITGYVVTPYTGTTAQTSQTFTSPALSETVTGLTNGTAYTFAVAAITGAGTGSLSLRSAKATPATAPDAPTNVTCFPCSASLSPAVAFVTPASNGGAPITGYTVTMIDNTDSTRGGQTFSGSASPISVSGFTNGDRYTFTVTATNAAGTGAAGTSGNILPIYPPAAPANVTASSFANASSVVSWTSVTSQVGVVSTPGGKQCTALYPLKSCTVTGLTNGTQYTFSASDATPAQGRSASATSNVAIPATLANAPTAVKATSGANASSSVSWKVPLNTGGAGITGYVVTPYIGSTAQTSQTFTSPALSETVTGLTNGTAYTFTVAAITGAGTGAASLASAAITTRMVTAISAGANHTCARLTDGTVQCWGRNTYGELGNGSNTNSNVPVSVTGLTGAIAIAAGAAHTCALLSGGTVQCWGVNPYGELGNGTTTNSKVPVSVTGLTGAIAITAGADHTCALLTGGTVQCWGWNLNGQLGNGTDTGPQTCFGQACSIVPVPVSGLTGVIAITAGNYHTCALISGGTVKCWGESYPYGQLGNGTTTDSTVPVSVTGLTGAIAITAGLNHTCALLTGGTVQCWGWNYYGQLGNGTDTGPQTCLGGQACSSVPVPVSGLTGAIAISAGASHTCALISGGTVQCWGGNGLGQLGNGTPINSKVPVSVTGLTGAIAISAGASHTCALISGGTVKCFGYNYYGQLGNGTTTNSKVPVSVSGL